jgi:hypothetical protein
MNSILIVDNWVSAFGTQLGNGIPILPFHGDPNDKELLHLRSYLCKLADRGGEVVETNRQVFGLERLRQCKESTQYLQHLQAADDINCWLAAKPSDGCPAPPPSDSEST